jgi:two-component system sensor histidine kinase MprB
MSFRRRVVLLSGLAVAVAVAVVSTLTYVLVRDELRGRVDAELENDVSDAPVFSSSDPGRLKLGGAVFDRGHAGLVAESRHGNEDRRLVLPRDALGGRSVYGQVVEASGRVIPPKGPQADLPDLDEARKVAAGDREAFYSDVETDGSHLRVYTAPIGHGIPGAFQVARPLDEVDHTLSQLLLILALVSLGGIALAGALGYFVSRAAVSPVERLRRAAEEVATTRDLSRRISSDGNDELSALADSFNQMLNALESSLDAQRQLVADASHELRTPLASLRTNIEVLNQSERIPEDERRLLLTDVVAQLEELTVLVGDLVELARDAEPAQEPPVPTRLDEVAADAVERARSRWAGIGYELDASPCTVLAGEGQLERAVSNLLDNAAKWSPLGAQVEVEVADGRIAVRDHGPGIDAVDMPRIFDRFYRSAASRGLPGSGLGLAIVRQIAESLGGAVSAANAPGGGAVLVISLESVRVSAEAEAEPAPVA